jgi:diguanylate cyclase (GGDEF)-like protein
MDDTSSIEVYAQEVLEQLIEDNLPPTPNNFSLYFDRLLESKTEDIRKQIVTMLELEESNDNETTIQLEQNLKHGFSSVKGILSVSANLYKNISLMTKILEKRKKEMGDKSDMTKAAGVLYTLESDIDKLNTILKKQTSQIKGMYDDTAKIIKNVENETIFDNQYGVYNKRYLLKKIESEVDLIKQFGHSSTLIMIELSHNLIKDIKNEKAIVLMTRTIARLLLKTSRRSDIVAHYGMGKFAMLLKHTDIDNAKRASDRLCDLVSNSNFFLADREIQLKISIGINSIDVDHSVDQTVTFAMDAMAKAHADKENDYVVYVEGGLEL